ncbi:phage integrase family protein [Microbacterium sp. AG1240]|uniref:tyrosine-type recombinase/integrase n=1 Tax=Microbacterium sp. AG1240 TaxID=2183992 RepID=UPI000EB4110D|nr:site-specific integrase [Microbacterium sp. AG1240]RKT31447.1 phage integrase family protein [Microbacterium sp. AG1240]
MADASARRASRRTFGNVKKLPSGRFLARYTAPDGTARAVKGTFRTKTDADAALNRIRIQQEDRTWLDPNHRAPTLGQYIEHFHLVRRGRGGGPVKPRTRQLADGQLQRYILPSFGESPLDLVTLAAVRTWHAQLPGSSSLRRQVYSLLRAILSMAVEEEIIRTNACRIKGAGQDAYDSRPFMSLDKAESIIAHMTSPEGRLANVTLHTQMRLGEALALRWGDVDLDARTIRVCRSVSEVAGEQIETTTKSNKARTVSIDNETCALLRQELHRPNDRVFLRADGTAMRHWHVASAWKRARNAVGLPHFRFHDLRHTGLTVLAYSGLPSQEIKARAGHSTDAAALKYQHLASQMDRASSDAFERAITESRNRRAS